MPISTTGLYNLYLMEVPSDNIPEIHLVTHKVFQGEAAALRYALNYIADRLGEMDPNCLDPDALSGALGDLINESTREVLCEAYEENPDALRHYLMALSIDQQYKAISSYFDYFDGEGVSAQCLIEPLEVEPDIVVC